MTQRSRAARMGDVLQAAFSPITLNIVDESARHAGHAGATPEGETHYNVRIVSDAFTGLSRVARSRAVHEALGGEFTTGLHALSLQLSAPHDVRPGKSME